jgi:hypothetical protein
VRETLGEAHARARLAERRMAQHPVIKVAVAPVPGGQCGYCARAAVEGRALLCPDCTEIFERTARSGHADRHS